MSLTLFRYLCYVSRFYCCSGRVSDGWDDPPVGLTLLLKQRKTNFEVSVHIDGGNEDWGFVSVILKISKFCCVKLILQIMTMINAKEKTEGSFPWTAVAPQRYPKKELLQMFWVFSRKTFLKVWFSKKVTTQWTGSLEKGNLLFRLLREFSKVRERGESYSLIS